MSEPAAPSAAGRIRIPRLYLVTDRRAVAGRSLPEAVAAALRAAGALAVAVQLREKDLPAAEQLALARALRAVTSHFGAALYVNDRVDVALAARADGVHLPVEGLAVADVRRLAPALGIGVSTHRAAEVASAAASGADFAVFGPVFETPSKRVFGPPLGLEALARASAYGLPVLALGGVNVHNGGACLARGVHGLAVARAALGARDPGHATRALCGLFPADPSA